MQDGLMLGLVLVLVLIPVGVGVEGFKLVKENVRLFLGPRGRDTRT